MSRVTKATDQEKAFIVGSSQHIIAAPDFVSLTDIADKFHYALLLLGTICDDDTSEFRQLHGRLAFFATVTGWCWHKGITEGLKSILELQDNATICWSDHVKYVLRRMAKGADVDYVRSAKGFLADVLSLFPRGYPFWEMTRDAMVIVHHPALPRFTRGAIMRALTVLDNMRVSWADPDADSAYRYTISDLHHYVIIYGKHAKADTLRPLIEYIFSHDLPEKIGYECYFQAEFSVGLNLPAVSLAIVDDELIFTAVNCISTW